MVPSYRTTKLTQLVDSLMTRNIFTWSRIMIIGNWRDSHCSAVGLLLASRHIWFAKGLDAEERWISKTSSNWIIYFVPGSLTQSINLLLLVDSLDFSHNLSFPQWQQITVTSNFLVDNSWFKLIWCFLEEIPKTQYTSILNIIHHKYHKWDVVTHWLSR